MLVRPAGKLVIPEVTDLPRVTDRSKLPRETIRNSAYVLRTQPHPVDGNRYFILTDHRSREYLAPLEKLADHHDGQLVTVRDLSTLYDQKDDFAALRAKLRQGGVKYIAIAPRLESFGENTLLSIWELLSTLDEDPQIDALPGFLIASNASAFSRLIEQSIRHSTVKVGELEPLAISQVPNPSETRSLQKAGILRKRFDAIDRETTIVAVYEKQPSASPKLDGKDVWNLKSPGGGKFIGTFPEELANRLNKANLIIMHGHGIPGMSCSVEVDGLPNDLSGKVLMTGSCFSASPVRSDLPAMREAPGGYEVQKRDAFLLRAIDSGAIVGFGHQRLSSGFPHLYPVLEAWLNGQTVGEGYQQLINGLISTQNVSTGGFVIREASKSPPQNLFLYVVIGDPALRPFAGMLESESIRDP